MDRNHCRNASTISHMPPQATNLYELLYCCGCGAVRLSPVTDWVTPAEENRDAILGIFEQIRESNDLGQLCRKFVSEARTMRKGYGETALLMRDVPSDLPAIVCLCGSTRFWKAYQEANYNLTMNGHVVLSVGFYNHASEEAHGEKLGCTEAQKIELDELHKRKIDLADWVYVLNVDGYIGDSTRSEIEYTDKLHKPIKYLEPIRGTK